MWLVDPMITDSVSCISLTVGLSRAVHETVTESGSRESNVP